nr:phospholipase A2 inhibitor-like [Leptinotarsa decemlineata]
MIYLFFLPLLLKIGATQNPSNITECYFDSKSPTRTFHSLVEYQGSKNSFKLHHPGYEGNVVNFDFKAIDTLPKNSFISFDSDYIIKLILDHKGIQTVDIGAFAGLYCLHELDLSFNNISRLMEGSFENLENLIKLNLSHNHLGDFPESGLTFFTLKGLRDLNLAHNEISNLDRYSFIPLEKLERLNLGFNRIMHINDGLFFHLSFLEVLELNNNYLFEVSPENWRGLISLKILNLAENFLISFDTTDSFSFVHLNTLNLSGNSLRQLNVLGLRKHLPELELLDISENNWFCEDLEIVKHHLKDSRISLSNSVNCSVVRKTYVKSLTTDSTSTRSSTPTPVMSTQRDYAKEVFLQNGEILVANKKLEGRVNNIEALIVWLFVLCMLFIMLEMIFRMGLFRRCSNWCCPVVLRHNYSDSSDAETVLLMRGMNSDP